MLARVAAVRLTHEYINKDWPCLWSISGGFGDNASLAASHIAGRKSFHKLCDATVAVCYIVEIRKEQASLEVFIVISPRLSDFVIGGRNSDRLIYAR